MGKVGLFFRQLRWTSHQTDGLLISGGSLDPHFATVRIAAAAEAYIPQLR